MPPTTIVPVDGAKLRETRVALGLSVDDAARAAGLSGSHLRNVELGTRNISEVALARVAKAYDLPVADLVDDDELKAAS